MKTVFPLEWRTQTPWKRRFYAHYMKWLERAGYVLVAGVFAAFVAAFNVKVEDVVSADGVTRAVGTADLADLATLFAGSRSTRHCWCTAFCASSTQFATGWFGGGNRRRFAELAASSPHPMGVLASVGDVPVGWCACGPRSRYTAAINGRSQLLHSRQRAEDDQVWLVACLYVEAQHRRGGVTHALVTAAIALARLRGAPAIEGWPNASSAAGVAGLFVGREELFLQLGFECVARPSSDRSIMRLDLQTRCG